MISTARPRRGLAVAFAGMVVLAGPVPVHGQREAETLSASFRKAAERVLPSIVCIRGSGGPRGFGTAMMGGIAAWPGASGVVIDAERGLILTTLSGMARIRGQFMVVLPSGRELPVLRVAEDGQADVAVLFVAPRTEGLVAAECGDSEALQLGDWVLAVGRPSPTTKAVSAGIVSGREATGLGAMGSNIEVIRSDVRLQAMGAGGPLLNLAGQVIGIHRVQMTPDGFGLAIPIERARRVASDLAEFGRVRRGYLGLTLGAGAAGTSDRGADLMVSGVASGSPAAEAGFLIGDRIVALDGRPLATLESLSHAVESAPVGQEFRITVERGKERRELAVKSRPRPEASAGPLVPAPRRPDRQLRPSRPLPKQREPRQEPLRSEGPEDDPAASTPPEPAAEPPTLKPPGQP